MFELKWLFEATAEVCQPGSPLRLRWPPSPAIAKYASRTVTFSPSATRRDSRRRIFSCTSLTHCPPARRCRRAPNS
jgi:hypothetical protein